MTDAESGSAPQQLVVGADLTLQSDRTDVSITTADGTLVVDIDSLGGLFALYDLQQSVTTTADYWLPETDALPDETPLAFNSPAVIRVRGRAVAHYVPDGTDSLLARVSSLSMIQLSPRGVFGAVAAEAGSRLRGWLGA